MEMNSETINKLEKWVGPETWYTCHPLDMERFYDFVNSLSKLNLNKLDESSLRDNIKRSVLKFHTEFNFEENFEENDELLYKFTSKIATIFDYLEFIEQLSI